ncbi:nucleoside triphosphate pyrophosphohydrolase [Porticoccus sp.]
MTGKNYQLDDLLRLMARLRDPDSGCPWDLKQSFETIVPFTLEEVYEVIDTIEREDFTHLKEELGDLLFQVVFYSRLGEEQGLFDFAEVVSVLVEKLVNRHPHVFPEGTLESRRATDVPPDETAIKQTWEDLKRGQRREKGQHSILADIPLGLPALSRAQKLQKRAATQGFDWPDSSGVFAKLDEEIAELKIAIQQGDSQAVEEELGDLLFSAVNLSRHLKVDAESVLRRASRKFEARFQLVERQLNRSGEKMSDCSPDYLEKLWEQAKQQSQ